MSLDPLTIGLIGLVGLLFMVVLGVRIAFAAAFVGLLGLMYMRGPDVGPNIAGMIPYAKSTTYALSVLPMFILIGYLAHHAGLINASFKAAVRWVGWMPGGLAISTVFATAGFAAVSGASTATAAVFSRIAIPEMLRYGYDKRMAAAVVAAGGTLASLIPPSAILVIYGVIAEQSIGRLLRAGFIPGIVSALIYAGLIYGRCWLNPSLGQPLGGFTWKERGTSLLETLPIGMVVFIILGGIYTGWMTPTEAGAAGAFVVFVIALARGGLGGRELFNALMETAKLTVMIFSIVWGVIIFVRFLAFAGVPGVFAAWLVDLPVAPIFVLISILMIYMVLGMFMDGIGMLLLTLPIVVPAVIQLGYDPIWFGILVVKMCEIGLITPPIGMNCYVVSGVRPDIPVHMVFAGVWPFVIADVITVGVLIAFPDLVLFLPNLMLG